MFIFKRFKDIVLYNIEMTSYTEAHKRAMKKYRNKDIELHREMTRLQVKRHRDKWRGYSHELKRLSMIDIF